MARILLMIGAVILLSAASALAQDAPSAATPPPADGPMPGIPRPPMGDRGGWMAMHRHHMAMLQKAAAFRFKRGDAEIDIKCAVDEPTRACVEAAATLIDKVTASVPH
jgi:hypothetical protein